MIGNPLAADVDFIRDADKATSGCPNCNAAAPARLGFGRIDGRDVYGCSECIDYPRCYTCERWIGDASGLMPYVRVDVVVERIHHVVDVCTSCWERME